MEYVIYKGKDVLFTLDGAVPDGCDTFELNQFSHIGSGHHNAIYLPAKPCDLELFRDTLHEVLTEIINKKRNEK